MRAIIPLKIDGDVGRTTAVLGVPSALRTGELGEDSRLVAYLIRVFRMPVARDKRTGSRNRTEEPRGPRCNCHSERTKSFRPR